MKSTLLSRLADRLVLCPTRHSIPVDGKLRRQITFDGGQVEVWTQLVGCADERDVDTFVLKFPGTGGRAERSTDSPAACWPDRKTEMWTVNPPGYGGSSGRASLQKSAPCARTVFECLESVAAGRSIVLVGNSLGCASVLYLAARHRVDGLVLRNPPPLREVIHGRFGWWNLRLGTRLIARHVPDELCAVQNACTANAPAVFLFSLQDRIVPPKYQQAIHDAYRGQKRIVRLHEADHATPLSSDEENAYRDALLWLEQRLGQANVSCSPSGDTAPRRD